jgi:membrane protein
MKIKNIFKNIFIYLQRLFSKFFADGSFVLASSIAFFFIFSIFPLMLIAVSISGILINQFNIQLDILSFIAERIPMIFDFVGNNISQIVESRAAIGVFGIVFLFIAATYVFDAIQFALNKIYKIKQQRRYWKQKLYGFLIMLLLLLIIGVSFILSTGLFYLTNILSVFFNIEDAFNTVLLKAISIFIGLFSNFFVFSLLYYFGTNRRITLKNIYKGAITIAIVWEAAKYIFTFYLEKFSNYELVYGSIASVIAFLFWVYISSLLFLLGAEINSIQDKQLIEKTI